MLFTLLKYTIYETCIDVFFDNLMKNFQISNKGPKIGDRYSRVYDTITGDTFFDCTLIPIENLSFYEDIVEAYREDGLNIDDLAFGMHYLKSEDDLGELENYYDDELYGETSFIRVELDDIRFEK